MPLRPAFRHCHPLVPAGEYGRSRQSEIEEQLDLTKNQAPNQLEAAENTEANAISEQPETVEPQTVKTKRGMKV